MLALSGSSIGYHGVNRATWASGGNFSARPSGGELCRIPRAATVWQPASNSGSEPLAQCFNVGTQNGAAIDHMRCNRIT